MRWLAIGRSISASASTRTSPSRSSTRRYCWVRSSACCARGAERVEELKTIYRNAVPGRIAELERALAAGDVTELRSIAHSLRGSGATYGFPTVTTAAAAVEDAPDDVITPRVHELIGVLREIIAGPAELSVAMRVLLV